MTIIIASYRNAINNLKFEKYQQSRWMVVHIVRKNLKTVDDILWKWTIWIQFDHFAVVLWSFTQSDQSNTKTENYKELTNQQLSKLNIVG
jgi:hypothetical protein